MRSLLEVERPYQAPGTSASSASAVESSCVVSISAPSQRDDRAHGCPIAALSGDLPNMPELAWARFADGIERLVGGIAKLLKRLGAKDADALAWSAMAEMAGALSLARTVADPDTSNRILRNSRAMVKSRLGLERTS